MRFPLELVGSGTTRKQLTEGGPITGIVAPIAAPPEVAALQEKELEAEGPKPLGAEMSSSAFPIPTARSTAATGACPSPTIAGITAWPESRPRLPRFCGRFFGSGDR
jgi:hypothetical protein